MSPTFRALSIRNYRIYAMGAFVSNVGTWMQRVAQDWLILQLTHSGTALGITTGLQLLPALLFSPIAGVVADRVPKRTVLRFTQGAMAIPAAILGILAITGVVQAWQVYALAFVFGIGTAFDAPARQSFVVEMVGKEDLANAVGLNSASFNSARMIGPCRGGGPDRRPRLGRPRHRLGHPGQRDQLCRGVRLASAPRRQSSAPVTGHRHTQGGRA